MSHRSSSDPFLWDEMKKLKKEVKQIRNDVKQLRNEVKSLITESKINSGNIWSIRNIFAQSYLDGLRELASESLSGILKIVWCSILIVSLILLTYQVTEIAKEYAEEVTITQVVQIETNLSELNRPSVCFTLFSDFLYRPADNGSVHDLEPLDNDSLLHLGYIKAMLPHFASSGLWLSHVPPENITWSQFQSLAARSWLSMSPENASLLSQTTLYDSLYNWGIGQLNDANDSELPDERHPMSQSKLTHVHKFYSDVLSRVQLLDGTVEYLEGMSWICIPINFSTLNWVSPSGKCLKWFSFGHYFEESPNLKLSKEMEFCVIYFNTKHFPLYNYYAWSSLETDVVYKKDTINYYLMPTKFQHQNLSRRKCHNAEGEIYPRGYGETICFHDCLWENHARLFNCSFWEDINPDEHQGTKLCHIFDVFDQVRSYMSEMCSSAEDQVWCNNETSFPVDIWNGLILQTYRDKVINDAHLVGCKDSCAGWMFCDEWELEYGLQYRHEIAKRTRSDSNWSGLETYREYTVSNFISVNKEVLKSSLEEFMANLGGTVGFYFGFSICGCMHLLLFLSMNCCGKVLGLGEKRDIQVSND